MQIFVHWYIQQLEEMLDLSNQNSKKINSQSQKYGKWHGQVDEKEREGENGKNHTASSRNVTYRDSYKMVALNWYGILVSTKSHKEDWRTLKSQYPTFDM